MTKDKEQRMTSLEIAEVTGKSHAHVMRDIRNMEPAWVKVNGRNFALVDYKDTISRLHDFTTSRLHDLRTSFMIFGGVSANEASFFAFDLHENSRSHFVYEHAQTKRISASMETEILWIW